MDTSAQGMVGVGGAHTWVVKATRTGGQSFSAVMMHVAKSQTGDEQTYKLNVLVEGTGRSRPGNPGKGTPRENPVAKNRVF